MNHHRRLLCLVYRAALIALLGTAYEANAQDRKFLTLDNQEPAEDLEPGKIAHNPNKVYGCKGPVTRVMDVAYEGVKITAHNWSDTTGGGESGRFDKTPVLTTRVTLAAGTCLDAHLSAIVGSRETYGTNISSIAMFQVTLTPVTGGAPQHMVGHFDKPYGTYGPAVALEAEHDVDMLASNFFQRVGRAAEDVPPGTYRVDVWWSGGPVTGGGAIGADFVLKLYLR